MKYYQIKVGLNSSQTQIMDRLKSAGAEVIQLSDSLCFKISKSPDEIKNIFEGIEQPAVTSLDPQPLINDKDTPPDLRAFLGSN